MWRRWRNRNRGRSRHRRAAVAARAQAANTAIGDRGCHALASAVAGGAFEKSTKARAAEINVHGHVAGEDESEGAQALQQACMIEGVELFGLTARWRR